MNTVDIARADTDAPSTHAAQDTIGTLRARNAEQDTIIAGLSTAARNIQRDLDVANQRHEQAVGQHRADVAVIGERLLEEAQERGWCSDYDTIVDQLNKQLSVELPVRELDHEVEADIRVTIRVKARGESDAEDRAGEIIRLIERDIDARPNCTANPQDSDGWDIRLA
jgi:hypothetical protein